MHEVQRGISLAFGSRNISPYLVLTHVIGLIYLHTSPSSLLNKRNKIDRRDNRERTKRKGKIKEQKKMRLAKEMKGQNYKKNRMCYRK